jgi:tetratricopeptide (TPR) repeat protein
MHYRQISILGGALLLTACTGLPVDWSGKEPGATQPGAPSAVIKPLPPGGTPAPLPEPAVTASAVDQLLGDAMQRRDEGDIEGGISLAERALRIDPRSPRVYYVLGVLQFDKGEVASALQLARKANALDTGKNYQESIDRLIEECELATSDAGAGW